MGTLKPRFACRDICGVERGGRRLCFAILGCVASFSKHGKASQGMYKKEVGIYKVTQPNLRKFGASKWHVERKSELASIDGRQVLGTVDELQSCKVVERPTTDKVEIFIKGST